MKTYHQDGASFFAHLLQRAIKSGDLFSANIRSLNRFYYSYNITLADLARGVTLAELLELNP